MLIRINMYKRNNLRGKGILINNEVKIEGTLSKLDVYDSLIRIICKIGQERIDGPVGLDDSIIEKYTFNSIDIMDVMIAIREEYFDEDHEIDVNDFMSRTYSYYEEGFITVRAIGDVITELYNGAENAD